MATKSQEPISGKRTDSIVDATISNPIATVIVSWWPGSVITPNQVRGSFLIYRSSAVGVDPPRWPRRLL
ncbi:MULTISPECIES: hypothetical protein [unclassified Microbacterium]|uniref:hypothetical protein n=1 Tax=unclassified Microbacterium TaxID=2609290 RepID=UPI00109BD2E3|nr:MULTISPECIES: hypothetical protein [unclassified Microbacterium]